jgi:hypothetical protein
MTMQTNIIYCSICESANIETIETKLNIFYTCSMCRDNEQERNIKENNFNTELVLDYSN